MAGGYGRGDQGRLAERVGASTSTTPTSRQSESDCLARSPARHCFVDGQPALLVEWRQGSGGWEGRVISMVWVAAVGWATVERWLPANLIQTTESRSLGVEPRFRGRAGGHLLGTKYACVLYSKQRQSIWRRKLGGRMSNNYTGLRRIKESKRASERLVAMRRNSLKAVRAQRDDSSFLLATWNLRDFDSNKFGFGPRLDESFYYIAEILACFDLIAIQEVNNDIRPFERLMKILGEHEWDYLLTDMTAGTYWQSGADGLRLPPVQGVV